MFLEANREYSVFDKMISHFDHALRTVVGKPLVTTRQNPAQNVPVSELNTKEKQQVAGLMRVNHAGEVAAQGLYQGHMLTARTDKTRVDMEQSAQEENDHLAWCEARLEELDSHKSYLSPAWYAGSLLIGMAAGLAGDKWSLGFVEETEQQVTDHLERHQEQLPEQDLKTAAIINQMKIDETQHAEKANQAGAQALPEVIRKLMQITAKIMTSTAYHV